MIPFFLAASVQSATFVEKSRRPLEEKLGMLPRFGRRGAGLTCDGCDGMTLAG